MQDETALSTTDAEIVSLIQCMRDLLAARFVTQVVAETLGVPLSPVSKIRAKAHVGNKGEFSFAHRAGATPRTKHIHTKHWFFKDALVRARGFLWRKLTVGQSWGFGRQGCVRGFVHSSEEQVDGLGELGK